MPEKRYEKSAACWQFEAELAAFLEGEDRSAVAAHAQECAFCGVTLAELEQIRSLSQQLPLEEPPPAVWANIRATLATEDAFREPVSLWRRWFPQFGMPRNPAAVGALACLVIFGFILLAPPGGLELRTPAGALSASSKATVSAAAYSIEPSDLARTVRELESSYKAREMFFEPTLHAAYEKSLESLNTSIRESLDFCRHEPSNALAREYLIAAYEQKAEVLASALELGLR